MRRLAAALLAGIVLLTGCSRTTPVERGARHPWTHPGELRLDDIAEPDSLNPLLSTNGLFYFSASEGKQPPRCRG
jgi:hypothetical protein